MTIQEIENILAAEGLSAYNMEHSSMDESESTRMGADGEYDLADNMESDNSPEALLMVQELLESLAESELEAMVAEDEPAIEEPEPIRAAWDFIPKKR